jgi:hypothetical protein
MADAPKKRKAQGPRIAKPIYILLGYTNEDGSVYPLDASRVNVTAVKDPVEVVKMFASGEAAGRAFVSFTPAPAERPATAA